MTAQAAIVDADSTAFQTEFILNEIKEQYLADARPWIVGFSGGKDSTTKFTFYATTL